MLGVCTRGVTVHCRHVIVILRTAMWGVSIRISSNWMSIPILDKRLQIPLQQASKDITRGVPKNEPQPLLVPLVGNKFLLYTIPMYDISFIKQPLRNQLLHKYYVVKTILVFILFHLHVKFMQAQSQPSIFNRPQFTQLAISII